MRSFFYCLLALSIRGADRTKSTGFLDFLASHIEVTVRRYCDFCFFTQNKWSTLFQRNFWNLCVFQRNRASAIRWWFGFWILWGGFQHLQPGQSKKLLRPEMGSYSDNHGHKKFWSEWRLSNYTLLVKLPKELVTNGIELKLTGNHIVLSSKRFFCNTSVITSFNDPKHRVTSQSDTFVSFISTNESI